ncbi:class I SAM-dependent methyltransferase [candidate division KSB1 bacterium]|nr:class I SAM-dependent methyltransferase [candidate division KSB1 bacterium]
MAEKHFEEQRKHTINYLLPYFKENIAEDIQSFRILEVGCAESGFLDVLREQSISAVGLEIEASRVEIAKKINPKLKIRVGDISNAKTLDGLGIDFDLIVMRDVIEHVPERDSTLQNLNSLLNPGGYLYITFPPRFSPFAGHQQHGRTILGKTPYLQLIPAPILRFFGKLLNEKKQVIETTIMNGKIGLSIRQFKALYKKNSFRMIRKELFLIRPAFQTRYGMKPRRIPDIPLLSELLSMGCESLLQKTE